jgi:hypothetical protein
MEGSQIADGWIVKNKKEMKTKNEKRKKNRTRSVCRYGM